MLLSFHASMLAYSATQHSPTLLEPAFLAAGLSHWKFGRFELFRVNPPLVRMLAALPVMAADHQEDWSRFRDSPVARAEFQVGADFIAANGERSAWLFTIARWTCLPFSLIGGLFCFFWSRELWRSDLAGLISLVLWTFDPNILAHGELITADCAAASLGLGAGYLFWRWLKSPSWPRAACSGLLLGAAELTKTSWVILCILWPLSAFFWRLATPRSVGHGLTRTRRLPCFVFGAQCLFMLLLALDVVNLGYGFDGSFTRLGDFTFVSRALTGLPKSGEPGNRFANSALARLPLPFPRQYVRGIDLQKKDLEHHPDQSYLRGEWKHGGWWYYYLYGLTVKMPHGSQIILLISVITLVCSRIKRLRTGLAFDLPAADIAVQLAPPLSLFALVSSQLEFNQHFRYVLPVFGFLFVFSGASALLFPQGRLKSSGSAD